MTEAELWKLAAQPVIFGIAVLAFLKAPWRVRLLAAAGGAAFGLVVGLVSLWSQRIGAPWWVGWAFTAPMIAWVVWRWLKRQPLATTER